MYNNNQNSENFSNNLKMYSKHIYKEYSYVHDINDRAIIILVETVFFFLS